MTGGRGLGGQIATKALLTHSEQKTEKEMMDPALVWRKSARASTLPEAGEGAPSPHYFDQCVCSSKRQDGVMVSAGALVPVHLWEAGHTLLSSAPPVA